MNISQKNISIIIFIFSILIFGYFLYRNKSVSREISSVSESNLKMIKINEETDYTTATGEYPEFSNASLEFNKKIADIVKNSIKEQSVNSEDNWMSRFETKSPDDKIEKIPNKEERFQLESSVRIIRNDKDVISFILDIYEFSGGAHGNSSIYTFNYNVVNQKEITLKDVSNGDQNFIKKVSDKTRDILKKDLAKRAEVDLEDFGSEMLYSGTEPNEENFSLFTLPEEGKITFHFPSYQVAPYVFGASEVTLDLPIK
jgi:hypothetical protein